MTALLNATEQLELDELFHLPSTRPCAIATPNILIVEDDVDICEGWSIFLRHQGYDVTTACNGDVGLAKIESTKPDVILLDLGLPGMPGFEILHQMRMRGMATRVIVVSAMTSPENVLRVRKHGAIEVVAKPTTPHELVAAIERVLAS